MFGAARGKVQAGKKLVEASRRRETQEDDRRNQAKDERRREEERREEERREQAVDIVEVLSRSIFRCLVSGRAVRDLAR